MEIGEQWVTDIKSVRKESVEEITIGLRYDSYHGLESSHLDS